MLYKVNHNFYIIQYLKKGFLNKFRRDAIYRVSVSHTMNQDAIHWNAINYTQYVHVLIYQWINNDKCIFNRFFLPLVQ